jgi:hypothetical protein
MDTTTPTETDGREDYYNAALVCITLICDKCRATLDPDEDLGPDVSFATDSYYILLGDEAFRRGWLIDMGGEDDIKAICPACAKESE